jgi:Choline/ethanolamine kinase
MDNSIDNVSDDLIKKYIEKNEEFDVIYKWRHTRRAIRLGYRLLIKIYLDRFKCEEACSTIYAKKIIGIKCPEIISYGKIDKFTYLIMEFVEGINLGDIWLGLKEDDKEKIRKSIDIEVHKMKKNKSSFIGNFELDKELNLYKKYVSDGNIYETLGFPESSPCINNIEKWFEFTKEKFSYNNEDCDFVFSHNDLGPWNIIVDKETLELKTIIDWEYAGFYPRYYEKSKKMEMNLVRI